MVFGEDRPGWSPSYPPPANWQREDPHWAHFDNNSVNAVSFGFVATAILISMFLVMAVFERFIRPPAPTYNHPRGNIRRADLESRDGLEMKLGGAAPPSPKMSVCAKEVSVLMPGEDLPTFIAHPAPTPCTHERVQWHLHQDISSSSSSHISVSSPSRGAT